jgi:hypothetical protein
MRSLAGAEWRGNAEAQRPSIPMSIGIVLGAAKGLCSLEAFSSITTQCGGKRDHRDGPGQRHAHAQMARLADHK